jgi:hypothetical protein
MREGSAVRLYWRDDSKWPPPRKTRLQKVVFAKLGQGALAQSFARDALAIAMRFDGLVKRETMSMKERRGRISRLAKALKRLDGNMRDLENDGIAFSAFASIWQQIVADRRSEFPYRYAMINEPFSFPGIKIRTLEGVAQEIAKTMRGTQGNSLHSRRNLLVASLIDAYEFHFDSKVLGRHRDKFSHLAGSILKICGFSVNDARDAVAAGLRLRERNRKQGDTMIWSIELTTTSTLGTDLP